MKNELKRVLIVFIVIVLPFSLTCNENPIEAKDGTITYEPGSRNYDWKLYPLNENAPLNSYTKIWGSSINNIWIIGSAGDFDRTILRFDGEKINNYGHLSINPRSVYGISSNEVWFAGTDIDFWKYDGNNIQEFSSHPLNGYSNSFLGDIWGTKRDNVYSVGSILEDSTGKVKGLIMHYNGSKWNYAMLPIYELHFLSIRKGLEDTNYFLLGYNVTLSKANFYEFNGSEITLVQVGEETNSIFKAITLLDGIIYFNTEKVIYKLVNGKFKLLTNLKNTIADGSKFWGRNEKDFFIQTQNGIGHFNGEDLKTLYEIEGNFGVFDALILDNGVYFIGYNRDTFNFFLIHGVKKN